MVDTFIKLSRSTVENFINCPRCCVLEKKYQIKPQSIPFTLNIAVDNLCKNEFDYYREREEPHPLFNKNNIDAIPFKHSEINNWRNNYKIILTGGYANLFKKIIKRKTISDQNITIKGISKVYRELL